jgi:putative membrane protein
MASLFAFIHHLAAFVLFAALVVEYILIKAEPGLYNARKILRADMIYGIASVILLAAGLVRIFYLEKGIDYYLHSGPFLAKAGLFLVMGLLSIYPTVIFLSWRTELKADRVPVPDAVTLRRLKVIIHAEMTGVMLIIACAVLMARGVGFVG